MRLLFYGCVITLIFGMTFSFVPLFPYGLLFAELLFVWGVRLGWQPTVETVLRDSHDPLEGDTYVVGEVPRSYLERGDPGAAWLVKGSPP